MVDDYGRFTAAPKLIRAACYPLQIDKVSDSDIGKWMAQVAEAGLVRVYPASDGKRYLQVEKFGQQVRSKSKYPDPPASDINCLQPITDAPVFVDVDVSVKPPLPPAGGASAFEKFWSAWPSHERKAAKDQCRRKWQAKGCEAIADRVLAALEAQKASEGWRKNGGEFIPSPLVWLNQARWEAPVAAAAPSHAPPLYVHEAPLSSEEKAAANEARLRALSAVKRLHA